MRVFILRYQKVNNGYKGNPSKKDNTSCQSLNALPASGINSINDMYIMTPAEKPKEADKKLVFVFFVKRAAREPIPVDKPAKA